MRVRSVLLLVAVAPTLTLLGQERNRDAMLTDITVRQPQYQVMTIEQVQTLYTQQQSLSDLKDKVDSVEKDVTEIKGDVQTLMQRDAVINFVLHCCEILFPGLAIAAFTVWFAGYLKNRPKQHPTHAA